MKQENTILMLKSAALREKPMRTQVWFHNDIDYTILHPYRIQVQASFGGETLHWRGASMRVRVRTQPGSPKLLVASWLLVVRPGAPSSVVAPVS